MHNIPHEPTSVPAGRHGPRTGKTHERKCSRHFGVSTTTRAAILGRCAENLVIWYLRSRHWQIIQRNFATNRGEIDIIARQNGIDIPGIPTVAFIEVKSKSKSTGLPPEINVTRGKQRKITAVMKQFIGFRPYEKAVYRCDIASVILAHGKPPEIRYIPNAFCAKEEFGW